MRKWISHRRLGFFAAAVAAVLLPCAAPASPHPIEEPLGYFAGPCPGTDSKPQSKLWYNEAGWWSVLDGPDGNRIFRLMGSRWVPEPAPDGLLAGTAGRADVVWNGQRLIVLVFGASPRLFEFSYDAGAQHYRPEPGFPVDLALAPGSETAVLAEDSQHRLWVAYATNHSVYVAHSGRDARDWSWPGQSLRDSLTNDDIATVIAFAPGRIGVMWSDQTRDEFGFRMREDASPPDVWGGLESIDRGNGNADDHVHLCNDRTGRVFAVTKDDRHHISAHLRTPDGIWRTHEDILAGKQATRPILMTAEADSMLVMLYTRWYEGAEIIVYRTAPLGALEFGRPLPFLSVPGVDLNDVTGTKQSLPPGCIVAIAGGDGTAWWNGWGLNPAVAPPGRCDPAFEALPMHVCPDAALALAFDEGRGNEVADSSPHGTRVRLGGPWADDLSEPEWTHGVHGGALRFNGKRDFAWVDPAPQLDIAGSITLEAWVRRWKHESKDALLCKGSPGWRTYQVRLLNTDLVEFLREVPGGKNHTVVGTHALADTLWHHVACVFDSVARESRIYVDGALDAAAPDSGAAVLNDEPLCIGARVGTSELRDWFRGDLDQLRITAGVRYSTPFTPAARFEAGPARLFIRWTPRYMGHEAEAYDLFRGRLGGALRQLNTAPLRETTFFDTPDAPGPVVYELRTRAPAPPGGCNLRVEWPAP